MTLATQGIAASLTGGFLKATISRRAVVPLAGGPHRDRPGPRYAVGREKVAQPISELVAP